MFQRDRLKRDIPFLSDIISLTSEYKREAYLVGGYVRDLLLRTKIDKCDFDIVVDGDALNIARDFAEMMKGSFVPLDEERGFGRVVFEFNDMHYEVDFTDFRGPDLTTDLKRRDFTIDAIAISLRSPEVFDPLKGREDLGRKAIRITGPSSFQDDPLRLLRAFSLKAKLGFSISPDTEVCIRNDREGLRRVSGERIREEVYEIFVSLKTRENIDYMDRLGILEIVFPEIISLKGVEQSPPHTQDVWGHSLDTLSSVEGILSDINDRKASLRKPLQELLEEPVSGRIGKYKTFLYGPPHLCFHKENSGGKSHRRRRFSCKRKRVWLLKLGALLHDIGKPKAMFVNGDGKRRFFEHASIGEGIARGIAARLYLSKPESRILSKLIGLHMRPGEIVAAAPHSARDCQAGNPERSERADESSRRREIKFLYEEQDNALLIILLALADLKAIRGGALLSSPDQRLEMKAWGLIEEYFSKRQIRPFRLIDGNDLKNTFHLAEGPLIGAILDKVAIAQAGGEITTRVEALVLAEKIIKRGQSHFFE